MKIAILFAVWATIVLVGCGPSGPPPQSTDPAAIEREIKEGKEIRNQLEK